ncbi:MAG: hypothetical protein K0S70_1443 [Microbacterium sp.]|jgi:hypothetical protein|nr:hypothetical protein [Microbacterium sp.]
MAEDRKHLMDLFRTLAQQVRSWSDVQSLVARDVSEQMRDRIHRSASEASALLETAAIELNDSGDAAMVSEFQVGDHTGLSVVEVAEALRDQLVQMPSLRTMREAAVMTHFLDLWREEFSLRVQNALFSAYGMQITGFWPAAVEAARASLEVSLGILNALDAEDEARASAARVMELETVARASAGNAGAADLSTHFGDYADRELRLSFGFRVATFLGFGGSIAAALLLHLDISEISVPSLVYRLTLTIGIAGLAAYFARLGGQHRRLGNWARSVQVQLQSLGAFTATITDETVRNQVQQEFARRVLGAPPERAAGGNDQVSIPVAEILTFLNKQAS